MTTIDAAGEAGSRKRTNDPDGLRRRVLDAAANAFQARGYQSATMQEVMTAAGATGGALHHHFPTKKSLGLAVIRERIARAVEEGWIAPIKAAPTLREGVAQVFGVIIAELDRNQAVAGCPLNNVAIELSLADPDFRVAINEGFINWRSAIADKLRADRARAPKGTPGGDPDQLATFIVAAYSGAMTMAKAEQTSAPLKECARQLDAILK